MSEPAAGLDQKRPCPWSEYVKLCKIDPCLSGERSRKNISKSLNSLPSLMKKNLRTPSWWGRLRFPAKVTEDIFLWMGIIGKILVFENCQSASLVFAIITSLTIHLKYQKILHPEMARRSGSLKAPYMYIRWDASCNLHIKNNNRMKEIPLNCNELGRLSINHFLSCGVACRRDEVVYGTN